MSIESSYEGRENPTPKVTPHPTTCKYVCTYTYTFYIMYDIIMYGYIIFMALSYIIISSLTLSPGQVQLVVAAIGPMLFF